MALGFCKAGSAARWRKVMANYPRLSPSPFIRVEDLQDYLVRWSNELTRELDTEDQKQNAAPATKIYSVVTITEIGRPASGDVAFAISAGKFKGYVSGTGWIDFH